MLSHLDCVLFLHFVSLILHFEILPFQEALLPRHPQRVTSTTLCQDPNSLVSNLRLLCLLALSEIVFEPLCDFLSPCWDADVVRTPSLLVSLFAE